MITAMAIETQNTSKILVSACLLGLKVRYDGNDNLQTHLRFQEWIKAGRVISICPEVSGGLSVPREPAEIAFGKTAIEVLQGTGKIKTISGNDVTMAYIQGAQNTLALAKKHGVKIAILKARSPSCGSTQIYDGSFSKKLIEGVGITAAILRQNGIAVYNEDQIDTALDVCVIDHVFE